MQGSFATLVGVICGIISFEIVRRKGYPAKTYILYGVLGFVLGVIGLLLAIAKKKYVSNTYVSDTDDTCVSNADNMVETTYDVTESSEEGIEE